MDWSIKRNVGPGERIHSLPKDQHGVERITFKLNKYQRSVLDAYCQESGVKVSDVVRSALQMYFDHIGYVPPADHSGDSNQLKLYPD